MSTKVGSRGEAPGGLGNAQPKVKFSPAFFKRRWGPGARPLVGLGKAQFLFRYIVNQKIKKSEKKC